MDTLFDGNVGYNRTNTFTVNGQEYYLDNVVGDQGILDLVDVVIPFNGFDDYYKILQQDPNDIRWLEPRDQYSFRAIDLDGDTHVDLFVFYPYTVMKTDLVTSDSFRANVIARDDAYLTVDENAQEDALINALHRDVRGIVERNDVQVVGDIAIDGYVKVVNGTFTAQGEDIYTVLDMANGTVTNASDSDQVIAFGGTEYDGHMLVAQRENLNPFEQISVGKDYGYIEVNGYLFIVDGTGIVPAASNYTVVTGVGASSATTTGTYQTDLLLTTGETIKVDAKVMNDTGDWWSGSNKGPQYYTAQPNIGVMYTYFVNSDGDYELTRVDNGNAADTTSVFDYEEVYKVGARLADENRANNDGVKNRFGTNTNGTPYFESTGSAVASTAGEKWTIDDDAVIFAFIDRDAVSAANTVAGITDVRANEYCVLTGADLKDLDAADVNWAFTGADIQSQGVATVQMGYVYLTADPRDEAPVYAYVDGAPSRVPGYSVSVPVITSAGEETLTTPNYFEQKDQTLDDIYNNLVKGDVVKAILDKDGMLVGYEKVTFDTVTDKEVTAYNPDNGSFTVNDTQYFIGEDTVIINVSGEKLQVGTYVSYDAGRDLLVIY